MGGWLNRFKQLYERVGDVVMSKWPMQSTCYITARVSLYIYSMIVAVAVHAAVCCKIAK